MPRPSSFATTARVCVPAVFAALSFSSMPLAAQQPAAADSAVAADLSLAPDTPPAAELAQAPAGPTRDAAAVAARPARATYTTNAADARAALAPTRTHHGPAVALMLVGATAVVLGIIVGGDSQTPLVVGGAVVGLVGLYQYLL